VDPLERDFYEERRRKWRRSAFWKGVLVTIGVLILIGVIVGSTADDFRPVRDHIAQIELNGVFHDDPARDDLLQEIADAQHAKALVVSINSPGGTIVGAESLFENLRRIAETRPVVAVMSEVAASGGYITAAATDHIVARGNTMTGSIGVIMEFPVVTELMDNIGVRMETIRSSDQKAALSPFRDTPPEAIASEQEMIDEAFDWFRGLVGERRGLSGNQLDAVATGEVFTGRMALENGLIDEIGGMPEALKWLESVDPELADLDVEYWPIRREEEGIAGFFGKITGSDRFFKRLSDQAGPGLYAIMK
jgi:protease IV